MFWSVELNRSIYISNMPPKPGNKKTLGTAPIKTANHSKLAQKEIAVIESLHEAENHQLNSFIKTRSLELDKDIKALRQKLKLSESSTIENDELTSKTAGMNLSVSGFGLGRVNLDTETISHDRGANRKLANPTFKLDPTKTKTQPSSSSNSGSHHPLITLLARIKLSKFVVTVQFLPQYHSSLSLTLSSAQRWRT